MAHRELLRAPGSLGRGGGKGKTPNFDEPSHNGASSWATHGESSKHGGRSSFRNHCEQLKCRRASLAVTSVSLWELPSFSHHVSPLPE